MHIVAITGSLREKSCNTGLLKAALKHLPENTTMDLIIPNLPLFNQDIEGPDKIPPEVVEFRNRVKAADCFLFATNEYNFSISGVLKNAIDWASRGPDGNLFNDKPAALVGAGGTAGTLRAQMHMRDIALFLNLHIMNSPSFTTNIYQNPSPFNSDGELIDQDLTQRLHIVLIELIVWTNRIKK